MSENNQNKEIDLIGVSAIIFKILKKRKYLILIITIAGTFYGLYNFFNAKEHYENTSICKTNLISNELFYNIANSLQIDFKNNEYKELSDLLKIQEKDLNSIRAVKFDTIRKIGIILKINGAKPADIELTKKAIISYYNILFKKEINTEIVNKREIIIQLQRNLIKIDSLQQNILLSYKSQSKNIFSPGALYSSEYIQLYEKKLELEKDILTLERDGIFSEIKSSETIIVKMSLFKTIIIYISASVIISVLLVLLYEIITIINIRSKSIS